MRATGSVRLAGAVVVLLFLSSLVTQPILEAAHPMALTLTAQFATPTATPTDTPTPVPTATPTDTPTPLPTATPTPLPTDTPTDEPQPNPTDTPERVQNTAVPSPAPTDTPVPPDTLPETGGQVPGLPLWLRTLPVFGLFLLVWGWGVVRRYLR